MGGLNMFDDLHDTDPPRPGLDTLAKVSGRAQVLRRRRAMAFGGSGAAVVALIVAAVVVPRLGDDDRRLATVDTVSPTVSPTDPAPSSTDSIIESTTPSTEVEPPTAPGVLDCGTIERPPVYLVDGSPPGRSVPANEGEGATQVRWGAGDAQQVTQTFAVGTGLLEIASGPQAVTRGDFRAAIVPTGDPPLGAIGISIVDDSTGCVSTYFVGPGLELQQAIDFATQWLTYLDVDRRMTVEQATEFQFCSYVDGETVGCLDVPDVVHHPLAAGKVVQVDAAVYALQLLVDNGAEATPLSSLARRNPLPNGLDMIVDLVPSGESCGTVTLGSSSINWAIGGSSVTCEREPTTTNLAVPFAAIDSNGDAVLVDSLDGTTRVLNDGGDPDEPLPTEGEVTRIDGVAVSPDQADAMVSDCCEPIPGTLSRVDLATGQTKFVGYGHLPAFLAGGNLVWEALGTISVGFTDGAQLAVLDEIDPSAGTVTDLAVVDVGGTEFVLAIIAGPEGTSLWKQPAAGGDMSLTVPISSATWTDDAEFSLAGADSTAIYVLDETNGALMSFDPESLIGIPVEQEPNDWISAWVADDTVGYVDGRRRLFVNDVQVPGEYLWIRYGRLGPHAV
jgi:hypothetical protein